MKYWLIAVLALFLLTACSDKEEGSVGELRKQSFSTFSIDVPSDWQKITKDNFANTIPEETVILYVKKIQGDPFIQNANVVKESINTDASSLEYAKANLLLGSKAITDYRPVSTEETVINREKTVYHLFKARSSTTEPLRQYAQSYFTKNRIAYTVTCIAKEDDATEQQACEAIVKSFRFL